MDVTTFLTALLSLGVVIVLAQASSLMARAHAEFQGRLRDRALLRARRLTALALTAATLVTASVGYSGWPSGTAPVAPAHAGAAGIGRDLRLSPALGASGLRPHLRKEQNVAD